MVMAMVDRSGVWTPIAIVNDDGGGDGDADADGDGDGVMVMGAVGPGCARIDIESAGLKITSILL